MTMESLKAVVLEHEVFAEAYAALADRSRPVFVTGRAGTGKTTLVRQLLADDSVKQVVVAPTGVAALQAGGQTIHSFFQIPPRLQNLNELKPLYGQKRLLVKNLERLIIDEISMVRADLLDKIDYVLRYNRGSSLPFGGVQVLMVGDFHQLPPVVPPGEARILEAQGYENFYAPGAHCLQKVGLHVVELQKIFRQRDPEFISMLGHIRNGTNLEETVDRLNELSLRDHRTEQVPVLLTGTNAVAERYNTQMLEALPAVGRVFEGKIAGDFKLDADQLPAPVQLELKVGARVMLLKNDKDKRWVNGSLATVTRIGARDITVLLDDDRRTYDIAKVEWERHRYDWNANTKTIDSAVVGSYSQLPVKLAWASTIHKAQGLSLSDVRIDLRSGAFASGQAYVALSRATSLAGLSLASPLTTRDVIVDARMRTMLSGLIAA